MSTLEELYSKKQELSQLIRSGIWGQEYKDRLKDLEELKKVIKIKEELIKPGGQDFAVKILNENISQMGMISDKIQESIGFLEHMTEDLKEYKNTINQAIEYHAVMLDTLEEIKGTAVTEEKKKPVPPQHMIDTFIARYGVRRGKEEIRKKGYEI